MLSVRSIVAIDLEFSGGILPKVTELAMVACERNHLVSGKELPRILHKLVMPVNPMKPITSDADKMSGKLAKSHFFFTWLVFEFLSTIK